MSIVQSICSSKDRQLLRDERISGLASGFVAFDYFSGKSGIVTYWAWRKNYLYRNNSSLHCGDVGNCIGKDDVHWFLWKTEILNLKEELNIACEESFADLNKELTAVYKNIDLSVKPRFWDRKSVV